MSEIDYQFLPLIGGLAGLLVGMTGVGGGALLTPALLMFYGYEVTTVIATDLIFAAVVKFSTVRSHVRNQLVDWQVLRRLWWGSVPGALFAVYLVNQGYQAANIDWLLPLISVLICFAGCTLLLGRMVQAAQARMRLSQPSKFKKNQPIATVLTGGLLGVLVGMTSIGAGAIGAVILRALYPLRMNPRVLVGSDTVHAIPVALIAGVSYAGVGYVDFALLLSLLLGGIPAALIGAALVGRVQVEFLRNILGLVLLLVGFKLLLV